jgi:phosphoribosyl 1,2-cyclic phosphate phosphodiesterase
MSAQTHILFLGTGTSQGVPVISCDCRICTSTDKRDKRLRTSALIHTGGQNFIIDTGPDFRQQMLTHKVDDVTAVLFTHEHKDHVAGLDDIRPYNFMHKRAITVYAERRVQDALKREFAYVFSENRYPGIPEIKMELIQNSAFSVQGVKVIPIRAYHYKLPVLGFRIDDIVYLTDIKTIPKEESEKIKGAKILVINALRKEEHISHMNLEEALSLIEFAKPERAYLTHLSHRFGLHAEEESLLPENVFIAYDGLKINL